MKRTLLLGRVSRGERQQDPENQLGPLRAVAQRQGWAVAEELSLKLSAWDDAKAREVWAATLEALDRTGADTLMVWALDRLTRGGIEDAFQKIRELDHRGVAFYSLQEPFLSTVDRQTRELMLALLAWAAKWESQRKSDRLTAKAATRRREAAKLGQRALWGRGRMPTDADVLEFRRLRGEGLTLAQVAGRTGFAKSTVHRALAVRSNPPPPAGAGFPSVDGPGSTAGGGTKEGR